VSRLLVVTRPALAAGFRLAGVEAFAAEGPAEAQRLIGEWLEAAEPGLLAIDSGLLAGFAPEFRQRLEAARHLPHLAIPSGEATEVENAHEQHIAELIRRAIGFHMTFGGEPERL